MKGGETGLNSSWWVYPKKPELKIPASVSYRGCMTNASKSDVSNANMDQQNVSASKGQSVGFISLREVRLLSCLSFFSPYRSINYEPL